jgi:hypothetical protein
MGAVQLRLRDRVFTRAVARRMTHPVATLTAGAAAAVPIAVGSPVWVGVLTGVGGWALAVAPAVVRRRRTPTVDPRRLPEPWAGFVREAQDAAARYHRALGTVPAGAVRQRLEEVAARVADGVEECFKIASRGAALDSASSSLDITDETHRLIASLEGRSDETARQTRNALQAQLDAAHRLAETRRQVSEQLHLLDARLDEAVARAVELGLSADRLDPAHAGRLGTDIDAVVGDMESLRQALEETSALTLDRVPIASEAGRDDPHPPTPTPGHQERRARDEEL